MKKYIINLIPGAMRVDFAKPSAEGEKIRVTLSRGTDTGEKNSLPALWVKHGFTASRLSDWWNVEVVAISQDGTEHHRYNPQTTKDYKLDFAWMLPATEENAQKIFDEIARRAGIVWEVAA